MSRCGRAPLLPGQVAFDRVTKHYLGSGRAPGLRNIAPWADPLKGREPFVALQDVTLAARPGERLGIIGPNGAGKSTLLKMLAGVVRPSAGTVGHGGRLGQMIELGLGFHPELTGRENIAVSAALFGLTRREAVTRTAAIAEFAGVEDALDTPVKRYSTGMSARLGFAVATQLDADVLAVDEVLSVGDREFQERCVTRINSLVERGVTLVFVSHEMALVELLCERVVLLDQGRVVVDGPSAEVIERYLVTDPSHAAEHDTPKMTLVRLDLLEERIKPWGVIHAEAEIEVEQPVPRAQSLFEITLPIFAPDRPFARCVVALPSEVDSPGRYLLRGVSSPMPMDGGHVRLTLKLIDPAEKQQLDSISATFRVLGREGAVKPHLASVPTWNIEPAERLERRPGDDIGDGRPGAAVALDHATKRYRRGRRRSDLSLLFPGRLGAIGDHDVRALDDVSAILRPGEAVGVIGANGAGKTTLLRVVAGVSGLSSGTVRTTGSVVSILELGVGMNPDYTGLENIELSAILLGLSRSQIAERTEDVLAFAGIGEAKHRPVKHYSSGMRARLGMAIALNVDADVLLIDELLGVGDHEFRVHALARLREIQFHGATVVFVSHNLHLVSELCDRVIRLERGVLIEDGPTASVVDGYGGTGWAMGSSTGVADVRIHDLELGARWVATGEPLTFRGWVEVAAPSPNVRLELSYRAVPPRRDYPVTASYVEEHTFLLVTVEPAGGVLAEPGWYRFDGQVDNNLLVGQIDVVLAAIDDMEGDTLAEGWNTVSFGTPTARDQLGPPLHFEWQKVEGLPERAQHHT